ncbi:uncharacterized protein G2W53_017684 [Senna tora]|uniref:Uncharacterized protein n=1 Tax=Senna tora TaxID=362788 RepID=A0A834WKE3_9FABA|nr:uncharacterized protein G2W53_017684 [Senna tora]
MPIDPLEAEASIVFENQQQELLEDQEIIMWSPRLLGTIRDTT